MKIIYLFHDLMNLYGDSGNVRYLEWALKERLGIHDVTIEKQTIGDTLTFEGADLIYCGAGKESDRDQAMEYLKPYRNALGKAILEDKIPVLFTGNSWTMLGKTVEDGPLQLEGLGIFGYAAKEDHARRHVQDAIYTSKLDGLKAVGFVNKFGEVFDVDSPLFDVEMGSPNTLDGKAEGYTKENFFGTYLTGPLLVKNPPFLHMLLSKMVPDEPKLKDPKFILDPEAQAGYEITLRELTKRMKEEGPEAK